jgi:hypothetical protein
LPLPGIRFAPVRPGVGVERGWPIPPWKVPWCIARESSAKQKFIDGGPHQVALSTARCSAHNYAGKVQSSAPRRRRYYGVAYRFVGGIISRGSITNSGTARALGRLAASSAILWRHLFNWVVPLFPRPSSGSTSMCGQSLIVGPRCRSPYLEASPLNAVFHNASLHAFRPASTI